MVAPSKFAHAVFQTHRFEEMIGWYQRVFEARLQHRDQRLAFLTYDDEHHRFAFINLGPPANDVPAQRSSDGPGLHHLAYTWRNLGELVDTYRRLKSHGVMPWRPIRHGLTLSLYYQDPDANGLEFQIDLMASEAATAFMKGSAFDRNPIGEPFDPELLAERWMAGLAVDDLIFRSDQPESRGQRFRRDDGAGSGAEAGFAAPGLAPLPLMQLPSRTAETEYLRRIDAIVPTIAAAAPQIEKGGRVPDAILQAMSDAGVFRALQPRRWQGLELHPAAFFDSVVRIGSACGSSGWIAGVVGVHAWHVALFDDRVQHEVWAADPDARISSSYSPTGRAVRHGDGYRLSGRWGFSSGVDHCGWALLGAIVPDDGQGQVAEFRTFLVPRSDYAIDEASWQVNGLQASGSRDVTISDAFVPAYRSHGLIDAYNGRDPGLAVNPGPLYRLPWRSLYASAIAAPAIGAALGAANAFVEDNRTRISAYTGGPAANNPAVQIRLTDAISTISESRDRMGSTWNALYRHAEGGGRIALEWRAQYRYEAARAIVACLEATMKLFEVSGGRVMQDSGRLQRQLRDLMAMRNHPFAIPEPRAATYARSLLGLPPEDFNPGTSAGLV